MNCIIHCSEEYTRNNLLRLIKNDCEFNVNNSACLRIELRRGTFAGYLYLLVYADTISLGASALTMI